MTAQCPPWAPAVPSRGRDRGADGASRCVLCPPESLRRKLPEAGLAPRALHHQRCLVPGLSPPSARCLLPRVTELSLSFGGEVR